jgi:hypothetical protein
VYLEELPTLPIDRVVKSQSSDRVRLEVGTISPQCFEFTKQLEANSQTVATEWEGLSFECTMSTIGNTIASFSSTMPQGVALGNTKVLFVFADHGSAQNNEIFLRILRSFRIKNEDSSS